MLFFIHISLMKFGIIIKNVNNNIKNYKKLIIIFIVGSKPYCTPVWLQPMWLFPAILTRRSERRLMNFLTSINKKACKT